MAFRQELKRYNSVVGASNAGIICIGNHMLSSAIWGELHEEQAKVLHKRSECNFSPFGVQQNCTTELRKKA